MLSPTVLLRDVIVIFIAEALCLLKGAPADPGPCLTLRVLLSDPVNISNRVTVALVQVKGFLSFLLVQRFLAVALAFARRGAGVDQ